MKRVLFWAGSAVAVLIAVLIVLRPEPQVWDPFAEVGPAFEGADPSSQWYDGYRKESRYIEPADGTRLAADIFLPGSEPTAEERFPTVLQYTAYTYGRAIALPQLAWWERLGLWWQTGRAEPSLDQMALSSLARALVARGYAFVAVEMRGVGASFGVHTMGAPVLGANGAEVVEWIGRQPPRWLRLWSPGGRCIFAVSGDR